MNSVAISDINIGSSGAGLDNSVACGKKSEQTLRYEKDLFFKLRNVSIGGVVGFGAFTITCVVLSILSGGALPLVGALGAGLAMLVSLFLAWKDNNDLSKAKLEHVDALNRDLGARHTDPVWKNYHTGRPNSQLPSVCPLVPTLIPGAGSSPDYRAEIALGVGLSKPRCDFDEYLYPNETYPEKVSEHLADMQKGWIISTGTERSLFDLICAPDGRCEGLIIRDINWKVKAFIDTIVLLLRICDTQEEFIGLALEPSKNREKIQEKLNQNESIPQEMKQYYLDNLNDLLDVYTRLKFWDPQCNMFATSFAGVNYLAPQHRNQFEKLKSFARQGKIIATTGSVNNINWKLLNELGIKPSVIDTSNIRDYELLDIRQPKIRIISTMGQGERNGTSYHSFTNHPLDPQGRKELDELLNLFKRKFKPADGQLALALSNTLRDSNHCLKGEQMGERLPSGYFPHTLENLKRCKGCLT